MTPLSEQHDLAHLIKDKYAGDASSVTEEDRARLVRGEPLAYVIGWQPFLGLRIELDSHPLIPRPETEWWTERLIAHLRDTYSDTPFTLLDLCSGSGAIGLAVAKQLPNARVTCAELVPEHVELIRKNASINGIDSNTIEVCESDLFNNLKKAQFDIIATNPPYIPTERVLPESVLAFEPPQALFSEKDGLGLIRAIAQEAKEHIRSGGELWLEADVCNVEEAAGLLLHAGAIQAEVVRDLYDRPRLVVSYW